jgi:hypothetical protein
MCKKILVKVLIFGYYEAKKELSITEDMEM